MSPEMLIVDPHAGDRGAIAGFFRRQGFLVTESADAREAQGFVRDRFFPVVLVDADVEPGGGAELVGFIRAQSPRTDAVLLTTRRAYDVAVAGFRRGAVDVVYKDPAEAARLREAVDRAVRRAGAPGGVEGVAAEVRALFDEMLARMVEVSGQVPATQSRISAMGPPVARVAVVDHEPAVAEALDAAARASRGGPAPFEVVSLPGGGSALDTLSSGAPEVVAVREDPIDLPASTLVAGLSELSAELVAVVYRIAPEAGEATVFEGGRPVRTVKPLRGLRELVAEIASLAGLASARVVRRRTMDVFRRDHGDLLRRYALLRSRLDAGSRSGAGG